MNCDEDYSTTHQGRQARRSGEEPDEVRADDQPANQEGTRHYHSADAAGLAHEVIE
jgi:hypothetical protein